MLLLCKHISSSRRESRSPKEKYSHFRKHQTLAMDPYPKQNIPNLGYMAKPTSKPTYVSSHNRDPPLNLETRFIRLHYKICKMNLRNN